MPPGAARQGGNWRSRPTDVAMMTTQLAFDISHLQSAVRHITRLRIYVLSLMPVLSSIGDRVAQLRTAGRHDAANCSGAG